MEPLTRALRDTRAAAESARAIADRPPPQEAVDVQAEFGERLAALAAATKAVAESLTDDGADPVSILGALQRLVNDHGGTAMEDGMRLHSSPKRGGENVVDYIMVTSWENGSKFNGWRPDEI
eukprot:jgi/Tetstr1/433420/TSEL_022694.t1